MKNRWGYLFLILGIAAMVYGAYRGEMNIIFRKAVVICLECIGIG